MRTLLMISALASGLAAPAQAERKVCHTVRTEDAVRSEVGAVLEPVFDRLLIEIGPIYTPMQFSESTSWRPVSDAKKAVSFYIYWTGDQEPGKVWRKPGSIFFSLSGIGVQWPNVDAPATQRLRNIRTVIRMGEAVSDRRFDMETANCTTYSAQVMPLHRRMDSEWPHNWEHRLAFSDEYPAWTMALETGGRLTVEFYDQDAAPFATAAFDLPPLNAFKQSAIDDIRDFRARLDSVNCTSGSRAMLP